MLTYLSWRLSWGDFPIRILPRVVTLLWGTILDQMWIPSRRQIHVWIDAVTETIRVFFYYNRYLGLKFHRKCVFPAVEIIIIFRKFSLLFFVLFLFLVFEIFQSLLYFILHFILNLLFQWVCAIKLLLLISTALLSHQIRHVKWKFFIIFVFFIFFLIFNDFGGHGCAQDGNVFLNHWLVVTLEDGASSLLFDCMDYDLFLELINLLLLESHELILNNSQCLDPFIQLIFTWGA